MKNYCRALEILSDQPMVAASIDASIKADLPNWCIVGGLIRDFAWGKIFNRSVLPRDIDLIYFNDNDLSAETDWEIESVLQRTSGLPFRVRNQARMHTFNAEEKYSSVVDAMSKFPTTVSAIGITSNPSREPVIFSVFGYSALFDPTFQITPHFMSKNRYADFFKYLERNNLRQRWAEVPVKTGADCLFSEQAS